MQFQRSTEKKLTTAVIAALIVIIGTNLIAISLLVDRAERLNLLLEVDVAVSRSVQQLNFDFKVQVQEWKNTLLRGHETDNREKYWGRFNDWQDTLQKESSELANTVKDEDARRMLLRFVSVHQQLGVQYRRGFNEYVASDFDPRVGDIAVRGIDREPSKLLAEVAERLERLTQTRSIEVQADVQKVNRFVITLTLVIAILVIVFLTWVLRSRLFNPLNQAIHFLQIFSTGELNRLSPLGSYRNDELGQLLHNLDTVRGNTISNVNAINVLSLDVNGASESMRQSATETSASTRRALENGDQAVAALEQLATAIQDIARNASIASDAATSADKGAHEGLELMSKALASVEALSGYNAEVSESMSSLEQDVNRVGEVLDVIKGVSEQTNLLALNAAIEAARAGEQGRGFAVVAEEVRNLAKRTQESTAEIQSIIESVQSGTERSARAMRRSDAQTLATIETASQASDSLKDIAGGVEEILGLNTQIAAATEEQSYAMEHVRTNITALADVIRQANNDSEVAVGLSQQLHGMADQLKNISSRYRVS
ncbi:methyl-accepting chemotaxis protein [Marinibactrum halimedae]|uniref:methyl-accepting chemotaxis protein n=1 Tax=Marinibactrum halimedae TaxID=1444977 RepID=UPI001E6599B7|nr:methyl-accepting chemotaxis protein [Marinibactrum halimedae]MCD9459675.1 methyl-accepting chemotaxis protein [Marinibactrum halimedae]